MAKKSVTTEFKLGYPAHYIFSFMANRYHVEAGDGFVMASFGLENRARILISKFSCILPSHTLQMQRENLLHYSDEIGLAKAKLPAWSPPGRSSADDLLPVVDFLHVSQMSDDYAEICFWNYSQGSVADIVKEGAKTPIQPWGVAMIRCSADLQREFLASLYTE